MYSKCHARTETIHRHTILESESEASVLSQCLRNKARPYLSFQNGKMLLSRERSSGSRKGLVTVHFEASLKSGGRWGEEITNVIKSKKVGLPKADFKIELQFFPEAVG